MNTKGTIRFEYDEFSDAPWENSDGHGPVRKSNNSHNKYNSDKRPGERPLNSADGRAWRITGRTGCWSAYANVTKSGSINQLLMYDRLGEISVQLESIK